ncbi:hypothetical protein EYF80_042043 [Liparis tanakae]|uniref:Uncharacterized protein n=1 Tax=Liparis tanakae TaxID=230148 RepID=A0A4Z2G4L5_9TELE|nr:hypothetical protein EYF80_042043 [Liparis tanakae]
MALEGHQGFFTVQMHNLFHSSEPCSSARTSLSGRQSPSVGLLSSSSVAGLTVLLSGSPDASSGLVGVEPAVFMWLTGVSRPAPPRKTREPGNSDPASWRQIPRESYIRPNFDFVPHEVRRPGAFRTALGRTGSSSSGSTSGSPFFSHGGSVTLRN